MTKVTNPLVNGDQLLWINDFTISELNSLVNKSPHQPLSSSLG